MAAVGINVINSADGKDSSSGIFGFIQQGFAERLGGIVAAAGGAGEFSCFFADKGTGDDTSDAVRLDVFISDLA